MEKLWFLSEPEQKLGGRQLWDRYVSKFSTDVKNTFVTAPCTPDAAPKMQKQTSVVSMFVKSHEPEAQSSSETRNENMESRYDLPR